MKNYDLEQLEGLYNKSVAVNVIIDYTPLKMSLKDVILVFGSTGFGFCINGINETIDWTHHGYNFLVEESEKGYKLELISMCFNVTTFEFIMNKE